MTKQEIIKKELINRLKKKFPKDTPIFTYEILEVWKEYSPRRVFQLLNELVEDKLIYKAIKGVYYFTIINEELNIIRPLSSHKIAYKKFISNKKNKIDGYYSGLVLDNMFNLSTQVPNITEIVSNNESSKRREILIGGFKYVVKRSKGVVNKSNYKIYQLFEAFSDPEIEVDEYQKQRISNYVGRKNDLSLVKDIAAYFPKCAFEKVVKEGILKEITKTE